MTDSQCVVVCKQAIGALITNLNNDVANNDLDAYATHMQGAVNIMIAAIKQAPSGDPHLPNVPPPPL